MMTEEEKDVARLLFLDVLDGSATDEQVEKLTMMIQGKVPVPDNGAPKFGIIVRETLRRTYVLKDPSVTTLEEACRVGKAMEFFDLNLAGIEDEDNEDIEYIDVETL